MSELKLDFLLPSNTLQEPANRLDSISTHKISGDANFGELQNYLLKHKLQLDHTDFFSQSNVFFFGEKHTSVEAKHEIRDLLTSFKSAGGTHFALEMLHQYSQGLLDQYFFSGTGTDEIRKQLSGFYRDTQMMEACFEILQVAKELGIQIIALDVDTNTEGNMFLRHQIRNESWASRILQVMKAEPACKILCYSGGSTQHLGYSRLKESCNQKLEQKLEASAIENAHPIVVTFACFDDDSDPQLTPDVRRGMEANVVRAARSTHLSNQKFAVIVDNSFTGSRGSDLIIHLPREVEPLTIPQE